MNKENYNIQANKLVNEIKTTIKKKTTALNLKALWQFGFVVVVALFGLYLISLLFKSGIVSIGNVHNHLDTQSIDIFPTVCIVLVFIVIIVICIRGINLTKVYAEKEKELCKELYNLRVSYLCERFDLTQAQLSYDLTGILNTHPQFKKDWWKYNDSVDVIENALEQKYRRHLSEEKTTELHIENLKLQNESLEIDNSQKAFWVCSFCGNTNRGEDMSCIKCGGIRSQHRAN